MKHNLNMLGIVAVLLILFAFVGTGHAALSSPNALTSVANGITKAIPSSQQTAQTLFAPKSARPFQVAWFYRPGRFSYGYYRPYNYGRYYYSPYYYGYGYYPYRSYRYYSPYRRYHRYRHFYF